MGLQQTLFIVPGEELPLPGVRCGACTGTGSLCNLISLRSLFFPFSLLPLFHLRPVAGHRLKSAALRFREPFGQAHAQIAADRELDEIAAVAQFVDFSVILSWVRLGGKVHTFEAGVVNIGYYIGLAVVVDAYRPQTFLADSFGEIAKTAPCHRIFGDNQLAKATIPKEMKNIAEKSAKK